MDFVPHIVALLGGGLATSLGLTYMARTPRVQARLLLTKAWSFALSCAASIGFACVVAYRMARTLVSSGGNQLESVSPGQLLAFGLVIGVPLALPGVFLAWSEVRAKEKARTKRRDRVATKDDRRAFAIDLVEQIHDVSPRPRQVTVEVTGDGGKVLALEGDIDSLEGERLTEALRADLADLGFKRVEGRNGTKKWWSRV